MYIASYIFVGEIVIREALNEGSILGMCICTYVSVTLKNVNLQNLRSCLECQFALILRGLGITDSCIAQGHQAMFLGDGGQGGQCGLAFAMYIFG